MSKQTKLSSDAQNFLKAIGAISAGPDALEATRINISILVGEPNVINDESKKLKIRIKYQNIIISSVLEIKESVNLPKLVPPITRGFGVVKHSVLDGCQIAECIVR